MLGPRLSPHQCFALKPDEVAVLTLLRALILVDQIERDIAGGHGRYRAVIDATVRRARPVVLTALAAILGMIPLASSLFWGPMAITIMGGLSCNLADAYGRASTLCPVVPSSGR